MDWFLYDNGLRHERVKACLANAPFKTAKRTFVQNSTRTKRAIEVYVFKRMLFLRRSYFKGDFIVEDDLRSQGINKEYIIVVPYFKLKHIVHHKLAKKEKGKGSKHVI